MMVVKVHTVKTARMPVIITLRRPPLSSLGIIPFFGLNVAISLNRFPK